MLTINTSVLKGEQDRVERVMIGSAVTITLTDPTELGIWNNGSESSVLRIRGHAIKSPQ